MAPQDQQNHLFELYQAGRRNALKRSLWPTAFLLLSITFHVMAAVICYSVAFYPARHIQTRPAEAYSVISVKIALENPQEKFYEDQLEEEPDFLMRDIQEDLEPVVEIPEATLVTKKEIRKGKQSEWKELTPLKHPRENFFLPAFNGTATSTVTSVASDQRNQEPEYPRLARNRGYEGTVVLEVAVSIQGESISVTVKRTSGFGILDEAAVRGVEKWKFQPATHNGIPVRGKIEVPIEFKLVG